MKLYYSPGACSLVAHIVLKEGGQPLECVKVDLQTRKTASGDDYARVNAKGYVPALVLDSGETLTENVAILDYLSQRVPALKPAGEMERTRLIEMLAFMSTEVHKPYTRVFFSPDDSDKARAREIVQARYAYLAERLQDGYLLGGRFSAADAFLFVTLSWAEMVGLPVPEVFADYRARIGARPAVQAALRDEGLLK